MNSVKEALIKLNEFLFMYGFKSIFILKFYEIALQYVKLLILVDFI